MFKFFLILIVLAFLSCENEKIEQQRTSTSIVINNYHRGYGNSSWEDNFITEIYNSQSDYNGYFTNPINFEAEKYDKDLLPQNLLDSTLESDVDLFPETIRLNNFTKGAYYIRNFNTYNHNKFVEFNEQFLFEINNPLDSITVINLVTERHYIQSFLLMELLININKNLLSNNEKVRLIFKKNIPQVMQAHPQQFISMTLCLLKIFQSKRPHFLLK